MYVYISGSKRFSTLSDTQTPLLPIFPLAFIQVSFVHGLLYSFYPVFFRSSSCSLLFRHPLQCYFGQSFFCHSLNLAVSCQLVLFNLFYNCFLQSNLLSYTFLLPSFLDILQDLLRSSISVVSTRLLFSVSHHVSEPYNKLLLINALQMFTFLSFLVSLLHSILFKHAIHFLARTSLDLSPLPSVPLVSKKTPKYLYSYS